MPQERQNTNKISRLVLMDSSPRKARQRRQPYMSLQILPTTKDGHNVEGGSSEIQIFFYVPVINELIPPPALKRI